MYADATFLRTSEEGCAEAKNSYLMIKIDSIDSRHLGEDFKRWVQCHTVRLRE
jgi:hypothetical protein